MSPFHQTVIRATSAVDIEQGDTVQFDDDGITIGEALYSCREGDVVEIELTRCVVPKEDNAKDN